MADLSMVDPELRAALDYLPSTDMSVESLTAARQIRDSLLGMPGFAEALAEAEERWIPGREGDPDVRVLLFGSSNAARSPRPALLHIHGGGYVIGCPEMNAPALQQIASETGCLVVSVDYRLAPETPIPGAIEDCYAALRWMHADAAQLGIATDRIGISGESAGGGLAAALALLVRDRGEFSLHFQHLIFPMLDDRTCTLENYHPHTGQFVWTRQNNGFGWACLLGTEPGGDDVSPYAAAARASDLSGLPQTYMAVGSLDLFLDENLDYAARLGRAGVAVEFHQYPGAYHGFQMAADAAVTRQANRDSMDAFKRFLSQQAPPLASQVNPS